MYRVWVVAAALVCASGQTIMRLPKPVLMEDIGGRAGGGGGGGRSLSANVSTMCGVTRSDVGNPLGLGTCDQATVYMTGQSTPYTVNTLVGGAVVSVSMMTVQFSATSLTGDCVRSCGVFTSTETDANGAAVNVPLDLLVRPPIRSYKYSREGVVPAAATTITVPYAAIARSKLVMTLGGADDPAYTVALNGMLQELANPEGVARMRSRALADAYDAGEPLPPQMHPSIAVALALEISLRLTAYSGLAAASRSTPRGGRPKSVTTLYEFTAPHTGDRFLAEFVGGGAGEGAFGHGRVLETRHWDAAEVAGGGSLPVRLLYAHGLAASELLFRDALGGHKEGDPEAPHRRATAARGAAAAASAELSMSLPELAAYAPHAAAAAAADVAPELLLGAGARSLAAVLAAEAAGPAQTPHGARRAAAARALRNARVPVTFAAAPPPRRQRTTEAGAPPDAAADDALASHGRRAASVAAPASGRSLLGGRVFGDTAGAVLTDGVRAGARTTDNIAEDAARALVRENAGAIERMSAQAGADAGALGQRLGAASPTLSHPTGAVAGAAGSSWVAGAKRLGRAGGLGLGGLGVAGGAAAGGLALYKLLTHTADPKSPSAGPVFHDLLQTGEDTAVTFEHLWNATNNLGGLVATLEGTVRSQGVEIEHLWTHVHQLETVQQTWNDATDRRLGRLEAGQTRAFDQISWLAGNTSVALGGLQDQVRFYANAATKQIDSLTDTVKTNAESARAQYHGVSTAFAGTNDVIELVWTNMHKLASQQAAREGLARAATAAMAYVNNAGWWPALDSSALTDVKREPGTWWVAGSPRTAIYVSELVAFWTELAPGRAVGPNGTMTASYSPSVANFVGRWEQVSVVCDRASLDFIYTPRLSTRRLLGQIGLQPGCSPAYTNMSLDTFLAHYAARVPRDADSCRCWLEVVDYSCPVVVPSATHEVIYNFNVVCNTRLHAQDARKSPLRPTLTAAGLMGIPSRSGGGPPSHTPCMPGGPPVYLGRRVLTHANDWEALWEAIGTNPRLRTGAPGTPSVYVGAMDQGDALNMTAAASRLNGRPILLVPIAHAYGAHSSSGAMGTTPLSMAESVLQIGFLTNDLIINSYVGFDATSFAQYNYYEVLFAATQGNMIPVYSYSAPPSGVALRADYYMPRIPAVPGVHATRAAVLGYVENMVYSEAGSETLPAGWVLPGDPNCWTDNCTVPCEGTALYVGQCEEGFTGVRSRAPHAYNLPQAEASLSTVASSRGGVLYNILRPSTHVPGAPPGTYAEDDPTYRFDTTVWRAQNNGVTYDPVKGGATASEYKVWMVPKPGDRRPGRMVCYGAGTRSPGDYCAFREAYYQQVPDVEPGGAQEYLAGSDAAACAVPGTPDGGTKCFSPYRYTVEFHIQMRLGEIHATVASVCPSVFTADAALRGTPAVQVQNSANAAADLTYAWVSLGLNDTLDAGGVSRATRLAVCVSDPIPRNGGRMAPNAVVLIPFASPCSHWRLDLYALNGATGTTVLCSSTPITFLLRSSGNPNVPISLSITTVFDDATALNRINEASNASFYALSGMTMRLHALELSAAALDPNYAVLLAPPASAVTDALTAIAHISEVSAADAGRRMDEEYARLLAASAAAAAAVVIANAAAANAFAAQLAVFNTAMDVVTADILKLREDLARTAADVARYDAAYSHYAAGGSGSGEPDCKTVSFFTSPIESIKCMFTGIFKTMVQIAAIVGGLWVAYLALSWYCARRRAAAAGYGRVQSA